MFSCSCARLGYISRVFWLLMIFLMTNGCRAVFVSAICNVSIEAGTKFGSFQRMRDDKVKLQETGSTLVRPNCRCPDFTHFQMDNRPFEMILRNLQTTKRACNYTYIVLHHYTDRQTLHTVSTRTAEC